MDLQAGVELKSRLRHPCGKFFGIDTVDGQPEMWFVADPYYPEVHGEPFSLQQAEIRYQDVCADNLCQWMREGVLV